jgi:NAD(P)-dependent dehydrogenase (short-subunit alcohol dehydrogenase family)
LKRKGENVCSSRETWLIVSFAQGETSSSFIRNNIDILVHNAGIQFYHEKIEEITDNEIYITFKTNIYSMIHLTRECVKHMKEGASIINTSSVTAFKAC